MNRYVLEADKDEIEVAFGVKSGSEALFKKNYNVIPGSVMPVVMMRNGVRLIENFTWGFKEDGTEEVVSEVAIEEVKGPEKRSMYKPCIVPASGFYKWKETVDDPLPFYLRVISEDVTGFAGVFTSYKDENGRTLKAFAILTMPANALIEPLDDRMPVILNSNDYEAWLNAEDWPLLKRGFNGDDLLPNMTVFRVPELVNDPSNNSKELIQPIPKLRNYDGSDED